LTLKNKQNETSLAVVRCQQYRGSWWTGGSARIFSKVYWNKETQVVYVDAVGLPEPPKGMVYQVWALKLNQLTPPKYWFIV
jgi:hypothetical protein